MAKRKNKHQQQQANLPQKLSTPPSHSNNSNHNQTANQNNSSTTTLNQSLRTTMVQPEEMSLTAHQHIQNYLKSRPLMEEKELTAILRLSTHLRVFGLLSAVGYINQTNDQEGKVREKTVPIWQSLLGQLINDNNNTTARQLMEQVKTMAKDNPTEYIQMWRKALKISHYWNFWGRAYKQ